jgi:hypothetical protein
MSNTFSGSDKIRNTKLNEGIQSLKSRIKGFDIDVSPEVVKEDVTAEPKYSKIEVADSMYQLYKDRVAPTAKEDEEILVPNTQATRGNARAVARSLAGMRNGGAAGIHTHFTHQCNGDVGVHTGGYHAMVVAGTEMTLEDKEPETETIEDYKAEVEARMEACWAGYKKKGMKKMFGKEYPNCVKEEEIDIKDEAEQLLFEKDSEVVSELKDKLMELEDTSWQSIDKVMRVLAKEHSITPKELHKQFKSENNGMIPDEWIKENGIMEEAGFMPLDEAINLNRNGNVYEVTGMWHAHTRRIKFFVPLTGLPTRDQMQEYFEMFYPGGKLISFYPSMNPGDNTKNEIVVVVPVKEEWVQLEMQSWVEMTDEECALYEMILAEEGEPTSPPMITDDGGVELWIEDHDTGEERVVVFSEGSLHDWFSKSKSKDGKPGWVQSDGSPCANEEGETKTPKCYSSARRASMSKSQLKSADARKSRQDPGQQDKSGAAKPTMVRTFKDKDDYKKHPSGDGKSTPKEECEYVEEGTDKKGKGSGTKDACYHKVKSRFKVWPSAYGSGALVKCRRAGASNWGNSSKKEEVEYMEEGTPAWQRSEGKNPSGGLNAKGVASYRAANPGSKLKTAVTTKPSKLKKGSKAANRRKSFCARMSGMKKRLTSAKTARDPDSRINKSLRKWNC